MPLTRVVRFESKNSQFLEVQLMTFKGNQMSLALATIFSSGCRELIACGTNTGLG